jgi:hypothetical protein
MAATRAGPKIYDKFFLAEIVRSVGLENRLVALLANRPAADGEAMGVR